MEIILHIQMEPQEFHTVHQETWMEKLMAILAIIFLHKGMKKI